MNCILIAICTIAVFLAGPSSASPSPLLDLSELTSALPMADAGKSVGGLDRAVPIVGEPTDGLLRVRSLSTDHENSSLEPRGMMPGFQNLSGMTSMIPGMGQSSGALPGMGGLTSMMPGMGGSNGGFLKVRRSTGAVSSHSKRLSLLGLDMPTDASQKAHSTSRKSTGQLLPLSEVPSTLSGLTL